MFESSESQLAPAYGPNFALEGVGQGSADCSKEPVNQAPAALRCSPVWHTPSPNLRFDERTVFQYSISQQP